MSTPLLDRLKQFLSSLEATQDELLQLLTKKHLVLTSAKAEEIAKIVNEEAILSQQLQTLLKQRTEILRDAKQQGYPDGSLQDLASVIAGNEKEQLQTRMDKAASVSEKLRQESWVHWIIAQRGYNHYTELLDMIAHCGEKAPTYSQGTNTDRSGSTILDTSA